MKKGVVMVDVKLRGIAEGRLGPATGIAGVMGANEVLKILLGKGELARGYLMSCSNFQNNYYRLPIPKDPHCPSCGAGK